MSGKESASVTEAIPSATADAPLSALFDASAKAVQRAIAWPSRLALFAGGAALVVMMGLTVADVVLRNLFAIVVPGGMEMTGLLMIIVALSTLSVGGIGATAISRSTWFCEALPDFVRLPTSPAGFMLTLATMIVTAVQILKQAVYLKDNGIVTGVLRLPEWPFVALRNLLRRAVRPGAAGQPRGGAGRRRQASRYPLRRDRPGMDGGGWPPYVCLAFYPGLPAVHAVRAICAASCASASASS